MTITPETAKRIRLEYPQCFRCGSTKNLEVHHAVYSDKKRFSKWLDMPENLVMLCHECNTGKWKGYVQSYFFRWTVYCWKKKIGYDMIKWHSEINMKVKDNFEI